MIKNIYNKYFHQKFFNKILLLNLLIINITLFSLALIISFNISSILQDKEILFNTQILESINNYMERMHSNAINALKQLYLENDRSTYRVLDFIQYDYDKLSDEYINTKQRFDNYIATNFSRNKEIQNIIIYKDINKSILLSEKGRLVTREIDTTAKSSWQINTNTPEGFVILPASMPDYLEDGKKVYSLVSNIFTTDATISIGKIVFDFDPETIKTAYSKYYKHVIGTLLVLTSDGGVIFDSSNRFYDGKYPDIRTLRTYGRCSYADDDNIINSLGINKNGMIVAAIIPKSEILSSIYYTRNMIFIVAIICALVSLLVSIVAVNFFSKRVNIIVNAMSQVRKGNFSVKLPLKNQQDEIGVIAKSFEEMCMDLKENLIKVYVSNIKQKNAELKALQSQINPHFLYNTLEAIRMRAHVKGNEEVSDMISILAAMFRSTIKEDMIIQIREEIKYCRLYMELFKIRFKDNLTDFYDVPEEIQEYGIIKHLIQPIFENYIVHGIKQGEDDNWFRVIGRKVGDDIILEFSDNGNGISPNNLEIIRKKIANYGDSSNLSIGLANIDERIKITFGLKYGIEISSEYGKGTKTTLRIAAKTKEELTEYVQGFNC